MNDEFSRYIRGLKNLRAYLRDNCKDRDMIILADLLQSRLEREISAIRKFGGRIREAEVNSILEEIIKLSYDSSGKPFEEWCDKEDFVLAPQKPPPAANSELSPDIVRPLSSQTLQRATESVPFLPYPLQEHIMEMFTLLKKAQLLLEQDTAVHPSQLAPIRQSLRQINREISPATIAACIQPHTPEHTSLVVAVNHVRECIEEVIKRLSDFEAVCQKNTNQKQRKSLQEKLSTTIYYMQQYPGFTLP